MPSSATRDPAGAARGAGRRCGRGARPAGAVAAGVMGLAAMGLAAGGCSQRPGALLQPGPDAPRWPAAPDVARVRYLGELRTEADLKPGRSFLEGVGRAIFGSEEPRGMVNPLGVCTDGGDRVFVADSHLRVVHVFDLGTRRYQRWTPPEDQGRFEHPVAVLWHPAGRLLVSDGVAATIWAFDPEGRLLGTLGNGELARPVGMAVDAQSGRVYVADAAAHRIAVLGPDGELVSALGRRGSGPGEFNYPTDVALGTGGRVYVSDSLNFRVQVLDREGRPLGVIGGKGDVPGSFAQPKGIAVGARGYLHVVDANFEAVQLFDEDGALLLTFGHEGHGPGEFWLPVGLEVDPSGRIWVADSFNRRVQAFQLLDEGGTR